MRKKSLVGVVMTLAMVCATTTSAFAATPVYQNGFDGELGSAFVVTRVGDNEDGGNTGYYPEADSSIAAQFAEGKNGQALSLDGKYGVELDAAAVGETYSVAFWINPARFSNYGPLVQIGSDLLSANTSSTWLNITKTDWDGDSAPVIWSRNETNGAWPWYQKAYFSCGGGFQIPKNEWSHIVVTVDGSQVGIDPALGTEVAGTLQSKLYINGELLGEGPVASGTFAAADAKVFLGINCWDIPAKALYDDFKIYDTVLTADEVKTAMNEGVTTATASAAPATTSDSAAKTGVESFGLLFAVGAAAFGTGSVMLKKKVK